MIQLAFITQGNSQYADRLWKLLEGTGIDPQSPKFQAAQKACEKTMPGMTSSDGKDQ